MLRHSFKIKKENSTVISPRKETETSDDDGNSPRRRKKFGKEKEEDLESEATIKKQTRKLREFFDYDTI